MKLENVKKVKLGNYPTPLEKMDNLTKLLGKGNLYIKRDDITGPAVGGNKTRKLEYLVAEALEQGCTALLTVGGVQTNHGRTTMGAAVKCGLKPILVVEGEDKGYLSGNLTLDALMGTDLYFVADETKMAQSVDAVVAKYEANGDKVYKIPEGGSNPLGAVGYIMFVKEVIDQIAEQNIKLDHLVCTCGSYGTFAGLLLGVKYFNAPFDIIAVPVSVKEKGVREDYLLNFTKEISEKYELGVEVTPEDIKIVYGPDDAPYHGVAYNTPDTLTREAIITLAKTEGIMLDPTYTGKTFRGFIDLVKEGEYIKDGESAMFLHTGGTPALWSKEHLDDMQEQLRANCTTTQL